METVFASCREILVFRSFLLNYVRAGKVAGFSTRKLNFCHTLSIYVTIPRKWRVIVFFFIEED